MRRSTAAAVGTLTGAALILGVRLSVQPAAVPVPAAADSGLEEPETGEPAPSGSKKPSGKKPGDSADAGGAQNEQAGLKAGTYKGKAVQNPYGTVTVTIKVADGKITAADATFPNKDFSGTINPKAVATLNSSTLKAQSAKVDAVSGATFTSQSYVTSLQAALDKAGA
ncbi:FMN-binding protein [Actinoplanes sp. NEAU-A12]|uniref:FMN-binding protein n=1 Tax=Actinoplanes sandaracinus TaxID=3045177 RepID=A0ABT6WTV2_9ACTN|nr:FMN-binding protein [Actinoplanes sandaracinus]MDI6103173.1 FMN-binding protein [Actinoplanes sandaracinus]